jgi:hypothetical protein
MYHLKVNSILHSCFGYTRYNFGDSPQKESCPLARVPVKWFLIYINVDQFKINDISIYMLIMLANSESLCLLSGASAHAAQCE